MYDQLNGLLAYSRIHTKLRISNKVDLNKALGIAINNLTLNIKERQATINSDNLPIVNADDTQMVQLFQNLISNSIRFSIKKPKIYISSKSNKGHYLISVKDNGIGIE
jgi:light-regulated signal transduction histidine kinase (bacteriophytochrome)